MADSASGMRHRDRSPGGVIIVPGPATHRAGDPDPRARRDFGLRGGTGPRAVREEVLLRLPFADLRAFSRPGAGEGAPLLVVPPMAGGFPVLLHDLVAGLLAARGRVAVADWFDARFVPRSEGTFGLVDNVTSVRAMLRALGPGTDVVAVCQGGVPALAASALMASEGDPGVPRSLALAGAPIDTLVNPTRGGLFARSQTLDWFDQNVISPVPAGDPGEGRLVYPGALQFQTLMAYAARHMAGQGELFWKFLSDDGLDPLGHPFFRLALGMMDLTREFFLDSIRHVFQEPMFLAPAGAGLLPALDLGALSDTALMTIEGEDDDLCSPGQTEAAQRLCRAVPEPLRARLGIPRCGHFSLFHGRVCRETVIPGLLAFWSRLPARPSGLSQRKDEGRPGAKLSRRRGRVPGRTGGKP